MVAQTARKPKDVARVACDVESCGKTFRSTYERNRHKVTHLSEKEKEKLYVLLLLCSPIVVSPFFGADDQLQQKA